MNDDIYSIDLELLEIDLLEVCIRLLYMVNVGRKRSLFGCHDAPHVNLVVS